MRALILPLANGELDASNRLCLAPLTPTSRARVCIVLSSRIIRPLCRIRIAIPPNTTPLYNRRLENLCVCVCGKFSLSLSSRAKWTLVKSNNGSPHPVWSAVACVTASALHRTRLRTLVFNHECLRGQRVHAPPPIKRRREFT